MRAREKKVKDREKSTESRKAAVQMDRGERETKTEALPPIIATSGAVTSFIFTHCEVFFVFTVIYRIQN